MSKKEWSANELEVETLPKGISYGNILLFSNATGKRIGVPIIALRGTIDGPVVGITAAIHGNELNGLSVTHKLVTHIDISTLRGTIILVPVLNIPGYEANSRTFSDGVDLNRIMPGARKGTPSEIYAYRLLHRIIKKFDCLLDLHTASFGRINSHYIRADMSNPLIASLAKLLDPQIIVHTTLPKKSMRNAAINLGVPALTVELGNPQRFQSNMISRGIRGILNVLHYFNMIPNNYVEPEKAAILCKRSFWYRVERGGILEVYPELTEIVEKGEIVATLFDLHGREIKKFLMPERGIIVGKSVNPVATTGARILHIGILGEVQLVEDGQEFEIEDDALDEDADFFDIYSHDNEDI